MVRLTKEEKKARKEAKKLEKIKAQIEARKQQKRLELQREMAAQALKRGELDRSWREMMLKIKEPIFRKDVEVMWHTFERVYDKKDHLINHTMKLMKTADDQYQRTFASFCDTIDTMINKFLGELEDMDRENQIRMANLLKRGQDDRDAFMTDHTAQETHLQLMLYHAHTTADALAWTTRGENLVKEDEERIKYLNIREDLRSFLEYVYNSMWEEYKAVLKTYVVNTADNQKQVRKLRRKENIMADIIATQGKRIATNDELLKKLRGELQQYESGSKQAVFRDRRDRHRAACSKLKQDLQNGVSTDEKQLTLLVKISDDAAEWLEKANAKCEKILRMAAMCRRYETLREKVLPFGTDVPQSQTDIKNISRRNQPEDALVINAIAATTGLTRLWHRVAKAELSRRALAREKVLLEQENEDIVAKIQQFSEAKSNLAPTRCTCWEDLLLQKIVEEQCYCNDELVRVTTRIERIIPNAVDGGLDLRKYKAAKKGLGVPSLSGTP